MDHWTENYCKEENNLFLKNYVTSLFIYLHYPKRKIFLLGTKPTPETCTFCNPSSIFSGERGVKLSRSSSKFPRMDTMFLFLLLLFYAINLAWYGMGILLDEYNCGHEL